jgi:hypothetical protein
MPSAAPEIASTPESVSAADTNLSEGGEEAQARRWQPPAPTVVKPVQAKGGWWSKRA